MNFGHYNNVTYRMGKDGENYIALMQDDYSDINIVFIISTEALIKIFGK